MKPFKFQEILQNDKILLKKHELTNAQLMFACVDKDRHRLGKFLPWVEYNNSVEDQENYLKHTHETWKNKTMFDYGIYLASGEYLGNIGVHSLRWDHDACEIGYWISSQFEGKGYISSALQVLEAYLFREGFNRIQIKCSNLNAKSFAVPERNHYCYEGLSRQDTIEQGAYRDTKTYAKTCIEFITTLGRPLVRRARKLDAGGIINAHVRSIRELCAKDYNANQIQAWSGRDFKESRWHELMNTNHVWVIDDGKKIQGFCDLVFHDNESVAEIRGLYLTPEIKGQGLGKSLLTRTKEFCQNRNRRKIILSSTLTAIDFYLAQGFQAVGERDATPIGGVPIDSQSMELELSET